MFAVSLALAAVVGLGAAATVAWAGNPRAAQSVVAASANDPPAASAAPTSSTVPPTTAAPTTPPPRLATLVFTGDVLVHPAVADEAHDEAVAEGRDGYDFSAMLAPIANRVRGATRAYCHLETPLSATDDDLSGYPSFRAPHEVADALVATGYDQCSVASNHVLDKGPSGVATTLDVMDAAGLGHVGAARSPEEAAQPVIDTAAGIRVGRLSYAYGFNGYRIPADEPWLANQIDPVRIIADATALRAAGAEVVVVSLHWGVEYHHDPTAEQQDVAAQLAASGTVDLVVGHHAHVVQPVTKVGSMWVVYGMGNLLSNNATACCPEEVIDGLLVTATIGDTPNGVAVLDLSFTPTYNERGSFRVLPVADALGNPAIEPALAGELRRSWDRTTGYVLSLDGIPLGVEPDHAPS